MSPRTKPVLVAVDDTLAILRIIDLSFCDAYTVHTFEDGECFLAWAEEHPPLHICILNLMMPGLDGLDIFRKLRERKPWGRTRIIILSSKYSAVNRERALAMGADAFEQKPSDPDSFRLNVRSLRKRQ